MRDPVGVELPVGEQNRHLAQTLDATQISQIRLDEYLPLQSMGVEYPTNGYQSRR
jgi:hypothetical protein